MSPDYIARFEKYLDELLTRFNLGAMPGKNIQVLRQKHWIDRTYPLEILNQYTDTLPTHGRDDYWLAVNILIELKNGEGKGLLWKEMYTYRLSDVVPRDETYLKEKYKQRLYQDAYRQFIEILNNRLLSDGLSTSIETTPVR